MKKYLLISICTALLLTSCTKIPSDIMRPAAETLKMRQAQSHTFSTGSDKELLRAAMSVLQDMGYTVKECSSECGVVTATKEASAYSAGQVAGAVVLALLGGSTIPIDHTQYITVTVVIVDTSEPGKSCARTTFQRIIVRTDDTRHTEIITDQSVYIDFYNKLEKSLFFEANNL